ncbi:MAG: imidazoleglycerol-phosphate dehydratase [Candidatus Omnitrophica bacterium]|nr:imidazoleglycerol-phosphate dehydratase [Candidatus Omnitrophota bacterium]
MKNNKRIAKYLYKTKETEVSCKLNIDGKGKSNIKTGIGFLDHMLELFAYHGLFDLDINIKKQDLDVDIHHTNEDAGICLGEVFKKALGDKKGIRRYATAFVPMEEVVARVIVDISGRPFVNIKFPRSVYRLIGEDNYTIEYCRQFLESFSRHFSIAVYVKLESSHGTFDLHHTVEAIFKALGRALDEATSIDKRRKEAPSTKGKL